MTRDERFMRRALELAERGAGYVNPNPLVGCVIVRGDEAIAESFHAAVGGPHAEAEALAQAGERARGAELYVNLEPCVGFAGKRTPPCADALIDAGIARVVVAMRDPTPEVSGRGIAQLQEAGITVAEGVCADQAERLNEIRTHYARTGRPFVLGKMATSVDGKIATRTGDARWISSETARTEVHRLRHRLAAVLVGTGTALQDDPRLTVRHVEGRDPWRIVLDPEGSLPNQARLFHLDSPAPTVVATTDAMPEEREAELGHLPTETPIRVWRLPPDRDGRVDVDAVLARLAEHEIDSVLLEGGAETAARFLEAERLDKLMLFLAPKLIGGREAPGPIGGGGAATVAEAVGLREVSVEACGPDLVYTGYPVYGATSQERTLS